MVQVSQVEAGVAHRPSAKGIRLIINSTRLVMWSSLIMWSSYCSVSVVVGDITARGIDGDNQPLIVGSTSDSKGGSCELMMYY